MQERVLSFQKKRPPLWDPEALGRGSGMELLLIALGKQTNH